MMELKEAIDLLKTVRGNEYVATSDYENALDTVLNELDNNVSKYYINSLLNKYKRVEKYQKENHSPRHSAVKVKGKIEVLKEILKHEEVE